MFTIYIADNSYGVLLFTSGDLFMKKSKRIISILITAGLICSAKLFSSTFFSGYAGGKLNYSGNKESQEYDPDLKLQAFFAGQFNFTQNTWSHLEFSIDTKDFLNESIFHETDALFQIDELSFTTRKTLYSCDNYFSAYMGTYDPIGSDIFLQRYFTISPIASKITDSYLGLASSTLYPHFGVGIADIVRLHDSPIAFGAYLYVNHEDSKYFVFNGDLRAACAYRYFTCDFAAGLGVPLADKYQGEDVIVAIDKLYWHAGTTMLFGNNYTTSLFLQAGINNASFNAGSKNTILSLKDLYLLLEPRFYTNGVHFNISIFSLPQETVDKLLFVDDSLGVDLNLYSDSASLGNNIFTIGTHISFSLINKNLKSITNDAENLLSDGYNINFTPYVSTQFLTGEIHIQGSMRLMTLAKEDTGKALSLDIGYRTRF